MPADFTPRRIACLQPSATVILESLGMLGRVVACTRYCADVCPEVRSGGRAIIADSWTAKAAEILEARPDLVIASVPYQEKSLAEILKAGARFLGLAPKNLADVYADIAAIAGVCGAPERGEQVVREMHERIAVVRHTASRAGARPRVYCEEWGKPLIRSQRWVAELVEAAGGEFVGEPGSQTLNQTVEAEDPDVIVTAWCGAGDRVPLEKIVRERGWEDLRAVTQGRVYCIRDEFLNTPAPTLLRGLAALAAAIHPQRFPAPEGLRTITPHRGTAREHRPRL
jgi:iron complex transport system substrate-binding protein